MAVTAADAMAWCDLDSDVMSEQLVALFDIVVGAVVAHIETHYIAPPSEDVKDLACLMQVNRWWMRKDSPGGVISFDDLGAVRVSRLDPDIAAMLSAKVIFS
jgi:hypothetical protein